MTMTIQELRKKRADAWDEARNFLDSKRTESGVLSDEDSAAYDAMEKNIVALGNEIERLERQERLGKELSAATSTPIVGQPVGAIRVSSPAIATTDAADAAIPSILTVTLPL